jgi:hypothetical protein
MPFFVVEKRDGDPRGVYGPVRGLGWGRVFGCEGEDGASGVKGRGRGRSGAFDDGGRGVGFAGDISPKEGALGEFARALAGELGEAVVRGGLGAGRLCRVWRVGCVGARVALLRGERRAAPVRNDKGVQDQKRLAHQTQEGQHHRESAVRSVLERARAKQHGEKRPLVQGGYHVTPALPLVQRATVRSFSWSGARLSRARAFALSVFPGAAEDCERCNFLGVAIAFGLPLS